MPVERGVTKTLTRKVPHCGCCKIAIRIDKKTWLIVRKCNCADYDERCYVCGRCPEHCCRTGWLPPLVVILRARGGLDG